MTECSIIYYMHYKKSLTSVKQFGIINIEKVETQDGCHNTNKLQINEIKSQTCELSAGDRRLNKKKIGSQQTIDPE